MYSSTTSLASALTHRRVRAERGSKNMKTKKSKCISPWQWRNHKNTCSHLESNWIRRPAPSQNKIIQTKNLYTRKSWAAKTWKPWKHGTFIDSSRSLRNEKNAAGAEDTREPLSLWGTCSDRKCKSAFHFPARKFKVHMQLTSYWVQRMSEVHQSPWTKQKNGTNQTLRLPGAAGRFVCPPIGYYWCFFLLIIKPGGLACSNYSCANFRSVMECGTRKY